jgi:hypothetical protein
VVVKSHNTKHKGDETKVNSGFTYGIIKEVTDIKSNHILCPLIQSSVGEGGEVSEKCAVGANNSTQVLRETFSAQCVYMNP